MFSIKKILHKQYPANKNNRAIQRQNNRHQSPILAPSSKEQHKNFLKFPIRAHKSHVF